jgi:hydrogenase nickel incorporation protein HypA/HybF
MHEFSILTKILPIIEETAHTNQLKKITDIYLQVGDLRQCQPEFLEFALKTLMKGGAAESARLHIEIIPTKMLCSKCKNEFIVAEEIFLCPKCGEPDLELLSGKEFILRKIIGEKDGN